MFLLLLAAVPRYEVEWPINATYLYYIVLFLPAKAFIIAKQNSLESTEARLSLNFACFYYVLARKIPVVDWEAVIRIQQQILE